MSARGARPGGNLSVSFDQKTLDSLRIERDAPRAESTAGRAWLVAVVLLVIVGGAVGFWLLRAQPLDVELARVVAAPAGGGAPAAVLHASGYVVARREATVSAKVTCKIATVLVEEGVTVTEGALLAQLDDTTLRPQLELTQTQLAARRAELDEVVVRRSEAAREHRRV